MSTELKPFEAAKLGSALTSWSMMDPSSQNHLWKLATIYATSDLVPAHFRSKPANVFIALQIAVRCGLDPFGVLQNVYIISGKPAFETKLALAMLNVSGKTRGPISYQHENRGKDRVCTASVMDAATGRVLKHTLHWATVETEGWLKRSGSKWATDPLLMLEYRSAMRLIRTHYPEVLLGVYSVDEVAEMNDTPSGVDTWDIHTHGAEREEEANRLADEQAEKRETGELFADQEANAQ
jgi:hypothetical protein